MKTKRTLIAGRLLGVAAILTCSAVALGQTTQPSAAQPAQTNALGTLGEQNFPTKPSADVVLSFVRPGLLAKVLVKEGQQVKAGQLLIQQDDLAEQAQLERLKAEAEDDVNIRASIAELDQKKWQYEKTEWAEKRGAATAMEFQGAKLDLIVAELRLELAKFKQEQARREYKEMQAQVDRMRLLSPIDGVVEELYVETGEAVDGLAKAVRVVNNRPLWVNANVPLQAARKLTLNQPATVQYTDGAVDGKIIHIGSVATVGTIVVRVELANSDNRPAGEAVRVRFADTGQVAGNLSGNSN